jgi:hypothetical protein
MDKEPIDIRNLKPVTRTKRLVLQENEPIRVTIWKIELKEKFYEGVSQGDAVTFEVVIDGEREPLEIQSKSPSSFAMLDDWDPRKAPCKVIVWKDVTGSKPEIKWHYEN